MAALENAKHETACQEYVKNGNNQSEAWRVAHTKSKAKPESVNQKASKLFAQVNIKSRVKELQAEAAKIADEQFGMDAKWLLQRIKEGMDADISDLYDNAGALKPVGQWPLIFRQGLVSGLEVKQEFEYVDGEEVPDGVVSKIKLSNDRFTKLLDMAGKHVGVQAWSETVTVDVTDRALALQKARERAASRSS